jgi:3-oxoacyl-(acyl-carrier-protein) synthase
MKIAISSIAVLDSLGDDLAENFKKICSGITGQKVFNENKQGFPIDPDVLEEIENSVQLENYRNVHFWQKSGYSVAVKAINKANLVTKKVSIILGSCLQGMMTVPHHFDIINRKGRAHPKFLFDINTHSLGSIINSEFGFENGCGVLNSACATGLYALEQACNQLMLGKTEAVLVLCVDFPCDKTNLHFFESLGAISKKGVCHPYHENRDGFLPGDGICAMILEPLHKAQERNIEPLAVIEQIETSSENYSSFAPDKNGTGIKIIMSKFNQENLKNIDLIVTHATGTPLGDFIELDTITSFISGPAIAFKGYIGHTQAAAGLLETAYGIMAMNNNIVPGMHWLGENENKNLSKNLYNKSINSLIKFSIGFNGSITGALISKYENNL